MTADELSKLIRVGDVKLPVMRIALKAKGEKITGHGLLQVEDDEWMLEFEPLTPTRVPVPKLGIRKPEDIWSLSGLIENELKFSSKSASYAGHTEFSQGRRPRTVYRLRLANIDVDAVGSDGLTTKQKDRLFGRTTKRSKYPKVSFHAVLFSSAPVFLNAQTNTRIRNDFLGVCGGGSSLDTFIDRGHDYDFALINRGGDLHIHLESKSGFRSSCEADDWGKFTALQNAIGFTHGFNAWPYRIEYWRDGKKMADILRTCEPLAKTRHAPFDRQLGMQFLRRKGTRNSVVRLAARFFENETRLSRGLAHLLFLFREAGNPSTHFSLRTLSICSLFEGLVNLLFEELELEHTVRAGDPRFQKYLRLRNRLTRFLRNASARNDQPAYLRLAGLIGGAAEFTTEDKYCAVCKHFGLPLDGHMKRRIKTWKSERNRVSHGRFETCDSDFENQSLIAGAINILVLKLFGYSGQMRGSAFSPAIEGRYVTI